MKRMLIIAATLAGVAAGIFAAPAAAPRTRLPVEHVVTENEAAERGGDPYSNKYMLYGGGPVQVAPHLYIVYWGDWTARGDPYGVGVRLQRFLAGVGGSSFNQVVTQYAQGCVPRTHLCPTTAVHITNLPNQLRGTWNDTSAPVPATPNRHDVAREAFRAARHFRDFSINAQYFVALPSGHGDTEFKAGEACAWHSWKTRRNRTVQFISLPYIPDSGRCGNYSVTGSILDGVTISAGHEYVETETDPWAGAGPGYDGWMDPSGTTGEAADKCAWKPPSRLVRLSTGTFPVQAIWSNYDRSFKGYGCSFGT